MLKRSSFKIQDDEVCEYPDLTRLQRRVLDAGEVIRGEENDQIHFLHSVMCHAGLPRKQTDARVFERHTGHMSTLIEADILCRVVVLELNSNPCVLNCVILTCPKKRVHS